MTYSQTLDYLFTRLPMFSRVGAAAYKADLTNTTALCNAIGNPQTTFKSIHIAGTNGKGSTSHLLASIFQTAGYKTGLYTSPHLKDFRERIKVDGVMCDEDFVVSFIKRIKPQIEVINPSFFELTVAMAFEYFANKKIDVAIIETGLGGRLDSTNIIHPEISIITNIGLDHINILGDTLDKIAFEKAGIIKQNTPVIIGEYLAQTKQVFINKASQENANIFFAQDEYTINHIEYQHQQLNISVNRKDENIERNYALDLTGVYQTKNLLTVLEACYQLKKLGWGIDEYVIAKAVSQSKKLTGLYGRWQCIQENPAIILDVGHNVDGISQILEQLKNTAYQNLHIIIGMVKDKDINAVLEMLPKNAQYYFTKAQIERALNEADLLNLAKAFQLNGHSFSNVNIALQKAKEEADSKDLILVCGSVFLVGEVDY
jgi:dihydrofolate synthase/folylpolyglutamate synthase